MRSLTREEFLELGGVTSGHFIQMQYMGEVALAFGVPIPGSPGRYLDCDLIAMALASELTESLGRELAANIVLHFFRIWADVVSRAETDQKTPFYFGVGALGPRGKPKEYLVTGGTAEEVNADFKDVRGPLLFVRTDINALLVRIRERGRHVGIDLSRPFFPPRDHPEFVAMLKDEQQARERRLRADRKKSRAAQERARRKDFKAAPRWANTAVH